jgi:plasmid rolling circle replication initiator protein Rep
MNTRRSRRMRKSREKKVENKNVHEILLSLMFYFTERIKIYLIHALFTIQMSNE